MNVVTAMKVHTLKELLLAVKKHSQVLGHFIVGPPASSHLVACVSPTILGGTKEHSHQTSPVNKQIVP